jgi:protocatechuate 3,4-dioxygenase alpha subunit
VSTSSVTPIQTVGPYFSLGLMDGDDNILTGPDTEGERIRLTGQVFDSDGDPLFNVLIEIWQANSHGRYNHPLDQRPVPLDPGFIGFGRASTDADGRYWFQTIKPGRVPAVEEGVLQAPHLVMMVHASGVAHPLATRVYFADDAELDTDPFLGRVREERRHTLLAEHQANGTESTYRFDIVLRGNAEDLVLEGKLGADGTAAKGAVRGETVFFALR